MKIVTSLSFRGQCREAFEFYAKVLGGKITAAMPYGDGPPDMPVGEQYRDWLMHWACRRCAPTFILSPSPLRRLWTGHIAGGGAAGPGTARVFAAGLPIQGLSRVCRSPTRVFARFILTSLA